MNLTKKVKGFTIIEVVLVLAIAGLIFLMVFIALPALQRGQRDTQRKDDLARLQTAITSYSSNNRGTIPASTWTAAQWDAFATQYLTPTTSDSFIDPLGATSTQTTYATHYNFTNNANALTGKFDTTTQNIVYVGSGYACSADSTAALTASGSRNIAIRIYLEGGGVYCLDN